MKIKNKGKVHPSPSSSSSDKDPVLAAMKLLPAAVLTLASALSPEEQEVLSYLLTRSLHLSSSLPSSNKKQPSSSSSAHRSPSFDCDCFDCYTSYWLRWDCSPNRDLIHRVIDAFEDHLSSSAPSLPGTTKAVASGNGRGGRRGRDKAAREKRERMERTGKGGGDSCGEGKVLDGDDAASPRESRGAREDEAAAVREDSAPASPPPLVVMTMASGGGGDHKGLARKVLPDVLGILNSRLWSLWSPNV